MSLNDLSLDRLVATVSQLTGADSLAVLLFLFLAAGVLFAVTLNFLINRPEQKRLKQRIEAARDEAFTSLKNWTLEKQLIERPAPRRVRATNYNKLKIPFVLLGVVWPLLLVLLYKTGVLTNLIVIVVSLGFMIVALHGLFVLWRKQKNDVDLLINGVPVGGVVRLFKYRYHTGKTSSMQVKCKVFFRYANQNFLVGYHEPYQIFALGSPVLQEGEEVTILVDPQNPERISVYKIMMAELAD